MPVESVVVSVYHGEWHRERTWTQSRVALSAPVVLTRSCTRTIPSIHSPAMHERMACMTSLTTIRIQEEKGGTYPYDQHEFVLTWIPVAKNESKRPHCSFVVSLANKCDGLCDMSYRRRLDVDRLYARSLARA